MIFMVFSYAPETPCGRSQRLHLFDLYYLTDLFCLLCLLNLLVVVIIKMNYWLLNYDYDLDSKTKLSRLRESLRAPLHLQFLKVVINNLTWSIKLYQLFKSYKI